MRGTQSLFTVNPAGVNPSALPDLTVSLPLANSANTGAAAGLIKTGTGTMALTAVNTYTGNTAINAGTLILADPGTLNSGAYAGNIINNGAFISATTAGQTLSGVISGTGSLTATGGSTLLILSGVNTYTGPTTVSQGATLYMVGAGSISDSSRITISNSATLDVSSASSVFIWPQARICTPMVLSTAHSPPLPPAAFSRAPMAPTGRTPLTPA